MHLTQFSDYALRTLMYLGQNQGRRCTAKEIAEAYDISLNHLTKIVNRLSTQGFITTTKGRSGGIELKKDPSTINLWHVIQCFEPDFHLAPCFAKSQNCCISKTCKLAKILDTALQNFAHTLKHYTLLDTLPQASRTNLKKMN